MLHFAPMKGNKVFIREPVAKRLRDSAKANKRSLSREAEQIIDKATAPVYTLPGSQGAAIPKEFIKGL